MREVYVYDELCTDFDNLGLVGALTPTSCEHEEIAGGMSEVVLVHPIDETGKYKALEKGHIIKATVPVRTTPEIDGTTIVTTVEKWHVDPMSTKAQRKVWSKREEGKKLGSLKANQEVIVVKRNDSWDRYKIKAKKLNGWFDKTALVYEAEETLDPNDPTAIEDIYPLWGDKEQLFRIYAEDRSDAEITVHARHISYDLLTNMTMYKNNGEVSLLDAVDGVFTQVVDTHEFTVQTNVADERTGVDYRHNNPINALFDPETGILKRWDVQLVRDNYELTILKEVGRNRGMSIEYGRNLTGVTCTIDTSNVVTCVLPTGVDHDGKPLYLTDDLLVNGLPNPNNFVFAKQSIRDTYPFEHVYHLECEDCTEGSEEADDKTSTYRPTKTKVRERMLEQALEVLWEDPEHTGDNDQASANTMPTVNLKVEFITLGDTEEYKQFKDLERLFLYDKVRVRVPKLNIDMLLDAVRVKTDCLTGHTVEVEIGAVTDIEVSVPSWAIQSISGGKIVAGTIPAGSFGPGVITADAIFSNAITTRHLAAESVTADKMSANVGEFVNLVAQNLTAETMQAKYADIATLVAGTVQATDISADHITSGTIDAGQITVSNIDAGNINTGTLNAGRIAAGSLDASVITAGTITSDRLVSTVGEFTNMIARDALIDSANIKDAAITTVKIKDGEITTAKIGDGQITSAKVGDLSADYAHVTNGVIDSATISYADVDDLNANYAHITNSVIDNASISYADVDNLDTGVMTAVTATIGQANITELSTKSLSSDFARIVSGKLDNVTLSMVYADTQKTKLMSIEDGFINVATIKDASITAAKIGSLDADVIDAGTLKADRLILRGDNGLYYQMNYLASQDTGSTITAQQLSTDEYKNYMHGSNLVAHSITADQITAGTITSNEILAGSIEAVSIKSGAITTTQLSSEVGSSLVLTSNASVNAMISDESDTLRTLIAANAEGISTLTGDIYGENGIYTTLNQTAEGLNVTQKWIEDNEGTVENVAGYMSFSNGTLTIGQDNNNVQVKLSSDELGFWQGKAKVAYLDSAKLYITNSQITNELRIGRYLFKPQTNNHMSLVYSAS